MKVQTSPYERTINRLARGDRKDCDLADELEAAVRLAMKERLETEARVRDLESMMRTLLLYVGHIPNDGTKMFAAVKQAQELLVAK